jgi:hypothetical protein
MKDLRELWTTEGILADLNHDGIPDEVNVEIALVTEECKPVGLIDFYGRIGLETTSLSLPFKTSQSPNNITLALDINPVLECSTCMLNRETKTIHVSGKSEEQLSQLLTWLASSWPHTLPEKEDLVKEEIIEIGLREDQYYVAFSSGQKSQWLHSSPLQPENKKGNAEHGKMSGLQSIWSMKGFFQGDRIDLNSQLNMEISFTAKDISSKLLLQTSELMARIGLHSTGICFPVTKNARPEIRFVINVTNESNCVVSYEYKDGTNTVYFKGEEEAVIRALTYFATSKPYEEGGTFAAWEQLFRRKEPDSESLLLKKSWQNTGEKNDLENIVTDWIQQESVSEDELSFEIYLSEPASIRRELSARFTQLLKAKTNHAKVSVRSAFKSGYLWIEEEVIPIIEKQKVERVIISCQEERQNGLELKNRWIQEMYPVDLLLAQKLEISDDQIEFTLNPDQESTYIVAAMDSAGEKLVEAELTVPIVEMGYIDGKQKVYPTTGQIVFYRNGQLEKKVHNPTDRERFWLYFANEVIPALTKSLPLHEEGRGFKQPFFSKLHVEVEMSEEERKLGFDEERISPLEALHEDLYFDVLDYFEYLGEERVGKGWNAPGGIHPFMHVKEGSSPNASIEVYGFTPKPVPYISTSLLTFTKEKIEPISCEVLVESEDKRESYTLTDDQWKSVSIPSFTKEVEELADLPGVSLCLGGVSYEGRPVPVVELIKPSGASYYSSHKLSLFKPTILIETGHHANEVSSMPAIRNMISYIASHPKILDSINVVAIPYANPDGVALHQRMTVDNPEWKHHAARYNAVGLEYAHVRYEDTIFGEADVIPITIHRWLPDIMMDCHGIPSHEWIQPFAGFNSPPRFPVSYWMPQSLIYGIARELDKEQYPDHGKALQTIIQQITNKINSDLDIKEKNEYWQKRYAKYGTKWLPDVFPIEQSNDMSFFHWDTSVNRSSTAYLSRYPEWCSVELITEAADETVYGEALERCVRAQELFILGVVEAVAANRYPIHHSYHNGHITYYRKRPLKL